MRKKEALILSVLAFAAWSVSAVEIHIENKDGSPIKGEYLSCEPNGDITFKQEKLQRKIKANEYKYARLAKVPDEITAADKKFAEAKFQEALASYKTLYNQYKYVGFDVYCLWKESACLEKLGKNDDAVARLKTLDSYQLVDKKKEPEFNESRKLLSNILIGTGKYDDALAVLAVLGNSEDDNISAFSFNAKGDILVKQNKKKEAILMFMRTALILNPQNKERPRALCQIANLLKELNDNRSIKFAEILKKDYPDNPFTKELK